MTQMKQALLNWQEAMHREGLSRTSVEAMSEFMHGAPDGGPNNSFKPKSLCGPA
ncbi:hypothetical protein [Xanthomonas axonopodis]|uniref:hypothetical protein n=1 Tax=Xanthomonas axonopodis TaxID=53413 RepID=UPI001553A0B8|nr:hypothetical protein [Xanthomonas axonopodis]